MQPSCQVPILRNPPRNERHPSHVLTGYHAHMIFDPARLPLGTLFVDPRMFDSRRGWRAAGFTVLDPAKDSECMVAGHPSTPGYLFKKYTSAVPLREQHANYTTRFEGAAELATFIRAERLQHILVPRKHLHTLPREFGTPAHILLVERLHILDKEASARQYHDIAEPVLHELLRVLVRFKGLDSNSKNVAFTRDGQIAFVDLEHWKKPRDSVRLKSINDYLSKDRRKLARKILNHLE